MVMKNGKSVIDKAQRKYQRYVDFIVESKKYSDING